jgi:hypothetical protein
MSIFDKNGDCVAIDHQPEAHTPQQNFSALLELLLYQIQIFR